MSEFSEFLPVILRDGGDFTEPHVSALSTKARKALVRLEKKRQGLQSGAKLATGNQVVIIASAQNEKGRFSEKESAEHKVSADRLTRVIEPIVGKKHIEVIPEATHELVLAVLDDPEVTDIIYIGHSERSNLILDKTITWRAAANRMTHLKHSIGVLGCATSLKDTVSPRFGGLLLPDDGILYGKHSGEAWPREAGDLTNFYEVSRLMTDMDSLVRPGQPAPNANANAYDHEITTLEVA